MKGIEGCKVSSKFSINEDDDGKTEFFMNFKEKKDLTNTKIAQELIISSDL